MIGSFPAATRLAVAVVAVGALSLGTAGIAGASAVSVPKVSGHFNCARASKALARIQRGEARIAAGLPGLTAAEAKAKAAGNTARATHIEKRITRLESPTFHARLTRATTAIEAKCHVTTPGTAGGSSASSTTQA